MAQKIYVANISFDASEDSIRELFEPFGAVVSVAIITDKFTGKSKGFGFVEMESAESAQKAIAELNGTQFMERTLTVAEAKPQQPREKRGFGGGRGGFGGGRGGFGGGRGGRR